MSISGYTGWDVGGAHLKVASISNTGKIEFVEQYGTPLWQGLRCLEEVLPVSINQLPATGMHHTVTMTAELVDIFKDREDGIKQLIKLCKKYLGAEFNLYTHTSGLSDINYAHNNPEQIASANWHATASYAAQCIESGILVDLGSTTTDIIPFSNGRLNNRGDDDQGRLRFGELIYTGVIRTPVIALAQQAPFNGEWQHLAAELFATTADIYRILGKLEQTDDLMQTADGGAKDMEGSIRRLARMLGTDADKYPGDKHWLALANYFSELQLNMLNEAIKEMVNNSSDKKPMLIGAGVGRFMIEKIADRLGLPYIEYSSLCETDAQLKNKCDVCAPAVAIAQLSRLSLMS